MLILTDWLCLGYLVAFLFYLFFVGVGGYILFVACLFVVTIAYAYERGRSE